MKIKRWGAFLTAGVLTASALLSGCGGRETAEEKTETKAAEGAAMGRYVEEELTLPKGQRMVHDVVVLEEGGLRLATQDEKGQVHIWEGDGQVWEENTALLSGYPQVADPEAEYVDQVALDPAGRVAIHKVGIEGSGEWLFVADETGTMQDYSEQVHTPGDYAMWLNLEFTEGGDLVERGYTDQLMVLDGKSGSLLKEIPIDNLVSFSMAGDVLTVIGEKQLQFYDTEQYTPIDRGEIEAVAEQIEADPMNLEFASSSSFPVVFARGEEENFFYCTNAGIFTYALGGNVTEQVVDGDLCNISSTSTGLKKLRIGTEQDFYLLAGGSEGDVVYHYTYAEDIPTTPGTTLKVYSLLEDQHISQWIPDFQKAYPDVYVEYEVGVSGEDGMTTADALKTLNTEIMAGKGPDVLVLDNLPLEAYLEKGILADLSGILDEVDEAEGLLPNIRESFTRNGKIYAMPTYVGLPMMIGTAEDLEGITDLTSMADRAEQLKDTLENQYVFDPFKWGFNLVETWTDTCSPAWFTKEGAVDEKALTEFLTQLGRLKAVVENPLMAEYDETEMLAEMDMNELTHYYGGLSAGAVYGGIARMEYGTAFGVTDYAEAVTAAKEKGLELRTLNGQAENTFVPSLMLGISSKANAPEAAENFIRYCFSSECQDRFTYAGFPVNETVLHTEQFWLDGDNDESMSGNTYHLPNGEVVDVTMASQALTDAEIERANEMLSEVTLAAPYDRQVMDVVRTEAVQYVNGKKTVEEAVQTVSEKLNLYLTE